MGSIHLKSLPRVPWNHTELHFRVFVRALADSIAKEKVKKPWGSHNRESRSPKHKTGSKLAFKNVIKWSNISSLLPHPHLQWLYLIVHDKQIIILLRNINLQRNVSLTLDTHKNLRWRDKTFRLCLDCMKVICPIYLTQCHNIFLWPSASACISCPKDSARVSWLEVNKN